MDNAYHKWVRIAIFNLILVALLGFIMRYKIMYPLPWVHQKHVLHAHSHFAFSGWITQLLMIFLVWCLQEKDRALQRYEPILKANLFTAYGMLLSFPFQGYGLVSISFSTASILVSYWFAWLFWKDINKQLLPTANWFKAALFFLVISSFGAFGLSVMMTNQWMNQQWYLAAVYFFLHFQYNGWFFFACMGLLFTMLHRYIPLLKYEQRIFRLFVLACLPAYCLSVLWLPLPLWVYIAVAIAAMAQVLGCFYLWKAMVMHKHQFKTAWPIMAQRTGLLVFLALAIKLLLQLFSTVPSLSDLAFGFRPVVIGYLHLVLLGIISLFLLTALLVFTKQQQLPLMRKGIAVFVSSIVLNEILLMLQGVCAMAYILVPGMQELLLLVALGLLTGAAMIFFGYRKPVYA
ncbi:MAG: hypothetical protein ACOYVG_14340 [Bacteroidota bacterium]